MKTLQEFQARIETLSPKNQRRVHKLIERVRRLEEKGLSPEQIERMLKRKPTVRARA